MSYLDRALDSARKTIVADIEANVGTANKADLIKYTRMLKNIRETHNETLESLVNARIEVLSETEDNIDDLVELSTSLSKVIDMVTPNTSTGRELPPQSGHVNEYLTTDGTNVSWEKIELSDISDFDSINNGDTPIYDNASGKFIGSPLVNMIVSKSYNTLDSLPITADIGDFAYVKSLKNIMYWNGLEWTDFGSYTFPELDPLPELPPIVVPTPEPAPAPSTDWSVVTPTLTYSGDISSSSSAVTYNSSWQDFYDVTGSSDLAVDAAGDFVVLGVDKAQGGYGAAKIMKLSTQEVVAHIMPPSNSGTLSFGRRNSVSTDGSKVIMGDREANSVHIYDMNGNLLSTVQGPAGSIKFGHSVKIDGDHYVVGAYESDTSYVYSTSGNSLLMTLTNPNNYGTTPDQFGQVVDISGDYVVVSTVEEDDAQGSNSGVAYVYKISTQELVQTFANPNAHGVSDLDNFGFDCAIDGTTLVVGAFGESDVGGSGSGKVYIYNVSTGSLVHTINNPNPVGSSEMDLMGWSVAVYGQTAIVSALYEGDTSDSQQAGKVYVYNVNTGNLIYTIDREGSVDQFGSELAMTNTQLVITSKGGDSSYGRFQTYTAV